MNSANVFDLPPSYINILKPSVQFECEETTEPWAEGEARVSRVVFIGRNLVQAELEAALRSCAV